MKYEPPDRSSGHAKSGGARAMATGPTQNTRGSDPLDDRMASRGKTAGFSGNNGAGVSAADINRGHMNYGNPPGTPPKTQTVTTFDGGKETVANFERMGWEPQDKSRQTPTGRPTDKSFDQYDGGFLSRDPFTQHERD